MRTFPPLKLLLLLTAVCYPMLAASAQVNGDPLADAANQFLSRLLDADFEQATEAFDSTMSRVMSPAKLKSTWQGLLLASGKLESRGTVYRETIANYDVIYIPCKFERKALDLKVVFDRERKIAGLFFVAPKSDRQYKLPAYVTPATYQEIEVTVGRAPWKLPGTLALPVGKGPFPAVVLVHGSGPNDRDETVGASKPFRDLGLGLASRRIITLRYDKRTKVHGAKMVASLESLTVKQETIDDVINAVKLLNNHTSVDADRICVLGHSLGGYLVPRIAARDTETLIASYIVLAGSTRPTEDLMWEQVNYILSLDGTLSNDDKERLADLKKKIDKIKSDDLAHQPPSTRILGAAAPYWLDLRGYEPAEQAVDVKRPMFILQGERDYQVTMLDFNNWKNALSSRDDVRFKSYPKLNHLFIEGKGKSTPSEYSLRGNVSPQVIDDVVRWIAR